LAAAAGRCVEVFDLKVDDPAFQQPEHYVAP
jgi:hypothetical protein